MAFALGEVSRERLQKHLHKLVPMLYRYTFDPIFPLPAFLPPAFLLTPRPYYQVHLRPQPEDPRGDEAGVVRPRARAQEDARRAAPG